MSGELMWDWGQGYMLVNTERTQAVCGYIGGISIAANSVTFKSNTSYGVVAVTTLDDDATIRDSKHLLLTAVGRARNTGTLYGNAADRDKTTDRYASEVQLPPEQRVAVLELGEAPIITEPIKGQISIAVDHPEKAQIFLLDDLGNRKKSIEPEVTDGKLEIALPGNYSSRMFEIIIQ